MDMIDKARIAVMNVLQHSNIPAGTVIDSEAIVRAAIEAMREPTDAMCIKGCEAGTGNDGAHYDNRRELARGRLEPAWQAMIDAALQSASSQSHPLEKAIVPSPNTPTAERPMDVLARKATNPPK